MNRRIITIKILVSNPTNNLYSFSTLDTFKKSIIKTINTDVKWESASMIKLIDNPDGVDE